MSRLVFTIFLFGMCSAAHAWDCTYWSQSSNPTAECYKAPTVGGSTATASAGQSQTQGQGQSQGQSSTNSNKVSGQNTSSNKNTSASTSSATNKASSSSAGGNASQGITTTTTDSGNVYYKQAANVVSPAAMVITGCQVAGQAGGSNTRASGMLGIEFTPSECYAFIQAQAYLAVGQAQAACEILNTTNAAQRALKRGAKLPSCEPASAPPVSNDYVTKEELQNVVKRGLAK